MNPRTDKAGLIDVEARVRSNAPRAGLIAGLLILFGFFTFGGAVGDPLFLKAHSLLLYTLRLGGLAMVIVAVWSSIGTPIMLAVDAAVCGLVGILLGVCAVMFMLAAGLSISSGIYLLAGTMLVSSCVHVWRDYRALPLGDDSDDNDEDREEPRRKTIEPSPPVQMQDPPPRGPARKEPDRRMSRFPKGRPTRLGSKKQPREER